MENNQKITYGLIGLLTVLVAAMGGNVFLTPDQLDNAVICSINQNVVIMDHLSSTGKTAYWINEDNTTSSQVCRGGYWLDLKQYAKDNDLDLNILLQEGFKEDPLVEEAAKLVAHGVGGTYECDNTKCWVKS